MHVFLKTVYMVTVMVVTGMMMVLVLVITPDFHQRLSTGFYRHYDPNYSQFVMQSLDNPGVFMAEVAEDVEEEVVVEGEEGRSPVKREAIGNYNNYTVPSPSNIEYVRVLLDYGRPQHQPWGGQGSGCSGLRVGFARRLSLPRTALASFPGSGNTWLRYLLQGATGLFTGSVYIDRELASKGFYGENEVPECGCTIVVKTHGYCLSGLPRDSGRRLRDVAKFQGRGVLLLRNPYDTLIAYRNYLSAGHLGVAPPSAFRGPGWAKFVRTQMEVWQGYAEDWITKSKSVLVVHYEHLLLDPRRELIRLLRFLRLKVEHRRLHCVLANLNGAFRRTTPGNTVYRLTDPFTPEMHETVEASMAGLNRVLQARRGGGSGMPPLPIHLYSYHYDEDQNPHHHHHQPTATTTTTTTLDPSLTLNAHNTLKENFSYRGVSGGEYHSGNVEARGDETSNKHSQGQQTSSSKQAQGQETSDKQAQRDQASYKQSQYKALDNKQAQEQHTQAHYTKNYHDNNNNNHILLGGHEASGNNNNKDYHPYEDTNSWKLRLPSGKHIGASASDYRHEETLQGDRHTGKRYHMLQSSRNSIDRKGRRYDYGDSGGGDGGRKYGDGVGEKRKYDGGERSESAYTRYMAKNEEVKVIKLLPWMKPR